jgi:hypothetical protein
MITAMTTALVLLVLTAFVTLIVGGLERNHAHEQSAVVAAPGSVMLDRDAERVAGDLHGTTHRAAVRRSGSAGRRVVVNPPRRHHPRAA